MALQSDQAKIKQRNGEIVLSVLRMMGKPATMNEIVQFILELNKVKEEDIKTIVKYFIKRGCKYGFVKRLHHNRFAASYNQYGISKRYSFTKNVNNTKKPKRRQYRRKKGEICYVPSSSRPPKRKKRNRK